MNSRFIISIASLALMLAAASVAADSTTRDSQGSTHMSAASARIANGSVEVLAGSGQLVVSSVEVAGDVTAVALRGASEAAQVSLLISAEIAGAASLAAGMSVQVTAESTGYLLTAAGRLIAFIPNELGRSLLHHSRFQRGG